MYEFQIRLIMTNFPFYSWKTVVKVVKRLGPGHMVIKLHLNPAYHND